MYKGKIILFIAVIFIVIVFCIYLLMEKIHAIKRKRNNDNSYSIIDEEDSIF